MPFPDMLLVRQNVRDRQIQDVPAAVRQQMEAFPLPEGLQSGASIAIGVGSRGISNIPVIVQGVVDFWRSRGFAPFIFPAMGSHGGATDGGQKAVLASLGVTEVAMKCPIVSSMEVVSTGYTPEGIETFMDRRAHESDGIFLVNRVKWHTDFEGTIESGLFKMMAIGVGKHRGAINCHKRSYRRDSLGSVIRSVGRQLLSTNKILGGLAVLEDGNNSTAMVVSVPALGMERKEEELLQRVKGWKVNIPMELDVLIVDEIGKIISGPGMDTKVVNRNTITGQYNPWKNLPWIGRIFVRSLHPDSYGNAMGVGMADVVHDRVLEGLDNRVTEINAITAQAPVAVRIPLHYPTDKTCLEKLVEGMSYHENPLDVRIGWIKNTKELNTIILSNNLKQQIMENPQLEIISEARPFTFDIMGQLSWRPFLAPRQG